MLRKEGQKKMILNISAVELDTSIQCRASVDTITVGEYAERMAEGDEFPPVVLFGTRTKCWIGDGWHRVLAAIKNGDETIHADLRPGNLQDALKHALGANAIHGKQRTNEDIRRSVNLALDEFPDMTNVALAELCRVSDMTISRYRKARNVNTVDIDPEPRTVTRSNGRPYTVKPRPEPEAEDDVEYEESSWTEPTDIDEPTDEPEPEPNRKRRPNLPPPCCGNKHAWAAIRCLQGIAPNDLEREQAFITVKEWIDAQD